MYMQSAFASSFNYSRTTELTFASYVRIIIVDNIYIVCSNVKYLHFCLLVKQKCKYLLVIGLLCIV